MKVIIVFFFFSLFYGCQSSDPNTSRSTEQLKQDVLDTACTDEMRREFEEEIGNQSKVLNEEQFRNSLVNMKANMKCGQ